MIGIPTNLMLTLDPEADYSDIAEGPLQCINGVWGYRRPGGGFISHTDTLHRVRGLEAFHRRFKRAKRAKEKRDRERVQQPPDPLLLQRLFEESKQPKPKRERRPKCRKPK